MGCLPLGVRTTMLSVWKDLDTCCTMHSSMVWPRVATVKVPSTCGLVEMVEELMTMATMMVTRTTGTLFPSEPLWQVAKTRGTLSLVLACIVWCLRVVDQLVASLQPPSTIDAHLHLVEPLQPHPSWPELLLWFWRPIPGLRGVM